MKINWADTIFIYSFIESLKNVQSSMFQFGKNA